MNTPDAFSDEPYFGGANQGVHILMGVAACAVVCLSWSWAFGEMPYKVPTACILAGLYMVLIEWMKQGWNGADSVVDSAFFTLGVCAPLVAFTEDPVTLQLEPQRGPFFAWLACAVVALAVYIYPRARRKYRG